MEAASSSTFTSNWFSSGMAGSVVLAEVVVKITSVVVESVFIIRIVREVAEVVIVEATVELARSQTACWLANTTVNKADRSR